MKGFTLTCTSLKIGRIQRARTSYLNELLLEYVPRSSCSHLYLTCSLLYLIRFFERAARNCASFEVAQLCTLFECWNELLDFVTHLCLFKTQRTSERSVPVAVRFHRTLELGDDKYYVITCGRSAFRNSRYVYTQYNTKFLLTINGVLLSFLSFLKRVEGLH